MRIVGGKFRGTQLVGPAGESMTIRPSSDRLRESLFNILVHGFDVDFEETRVLDLFAGTGALGFEAMSRGAKACLFVDDSAEARGIIRQNQEAMGLTGSTRLFRRDATDMGRMGTGEAYTLAFLDPPYNKGLADRALVSLIDGGWLTGEALVIVEESTAAPVAFPPGLQPVDERRYGAAKVVIARVNTGDHKEPVPKVFG